MGSLYKGDNCSYSQEPIKTSKKMKNKSEFLYMILNIKVLTKFSLFTKSVNTKKLLELIIMNMGFYQCDPPHTHFNKKVYH